ncbi:MAG: ABC transporter substrate-binding protein [Proteobacteria bacterium]|nr:ABC transporter substrate-binding protein [Pseudomonadota bacterium]
MPARQARLDPVPTLRKFGANEKGNVMIRVGHLALAMVAVAITFASQVRAETIRLGAILPLTGPGALIGTAQMRGLQFAAEAVNAKGGIRGNQIELIFEDNQAKPDQSVIIFNKLVDLQHLPMIFTAYSGPTLAMAPLATRKKVLMVNGGAQADKLATASPYLINTLPTIGDEVKVLAKYLAKKQLTRGAILFENSAAGIAGRDDYVKFYPESGGTVLAQEPTQFGQTDFRPALLKIADAKPQVMMVSITAGLLQMAQQYKQLGNDFVVAGTTFFADAELIADPASEGFVHTQVRIDAPPELAAAFKAKYGADMDFFARQYYNAMQIVMTTIDKTLADGKPITGENLRETLFAIRSFKGLIPLEFKTNTASVQLDINVMKGGKDVTVEQMTSD